MVVITKMDDAFTRLFDRLFSSFRLSDFGLIIYGLTLGFFLSLAVYGFITLKSLQKKSLSLETKKESMSKEEVSDITKKYQEIYARDSEGLVISSQLTLLKDILRKMTIEIATYYYPNSKYPFAELTTNEMIIYVRYVTTRIQQLFDNPFLKPFQELTLSQVLTFLDYKKKVDDVKVVQAYKKAHGSKIAGAFMASLHFINPFYWIKKITKQTTMHFVVKKLCALIISIVSDETSAAYSKELYEKEQKKQQIETLQLKEFIEELGKEEQNES